MRSVARIERPFRWVVGLAVLAAAGLILIDSTTEDPAAPSPDIEEREQAAQSAGSSGGPIRGEANANNEQSLAQLLAQLEEVALREDLAAGQVLVDQIVPFGNAAATPVRDILLTREGLITSETIYRQLLVALLQRIACTATSESLFVSFERMEAGGGRDIAEFQSRALRVMASIVARFPTPRILEDTIVLMESARKPGVRKALFLLASLIGAGEKRIVDTVRRIMTADPDPDIRAAAIGVLLKIGDPSDAPQVASILDSSIRSPTAQNGQESYLLAAALVTWVGAGSALNLMRDSIRDATYSPNVSGLASALYEHWYRVQPQADLAPLLELIAPGSHPNEQQLGLAVVNHWLADDPQALQIAPLIEDVFRSTEYGFEVRTNALLTMANLPQGDVHFLRLYEAALSEGGRLESESRALLPYLLVKHPYSEAARSRLAKELSTLDTPARLTLINGMRLEAFGMAFEEGSDPFRTILQQAISSNSDPEARAAAKRVLEANESSIRGH